MSLRQHLRVATQAAHDRVDAAASGFDLSGRDGYRRFLTAHAAALFPLEAALDGYGAERLLPDWPLRRRAQALAADLAALSAEPGQTFTLPPLSDEAAVWGVLYVLEGSRLGARVLHERVGSGLPTAYLTQGEGLRLWPSFVRALDLSGAGATEAERGAELAFARFSAAFACANLFA